MIYELKIDSDCWYVQEEHTESIKKTDGFKHLEEALAHPGQSIQLQNLYFILENPGDMSNSEFTTLIGGSDYTARCYDEAREEQRHNGKLMHLLRSQQENVESSENDPFENAEESVLETKKYLSRNMHQEPNLDKLVSQPYHKMYSSIRRALKKLRRTCPILAAHLDKTIKLGATLTYEPEKDDDFDLIIREV